MLQMAKKVCRIIRIFAADFTMTLMKHVILMCLLLAAQTQVSAQGRLTVKPVARNAVRIQYTAQKPSVELPDWIYEQRDVATVTDIKAEVDEARQTVTIKDWKGQTVFKTVLDGGRRTYLRGNPRHPVAR